MPTFQVRNKRTKIVLGEVTVAEPEELLGELALTTGSTIEDIARSLGGTVEEAKAALDVIEVAPPVQPQRNGTSKKEFALLPRRRLFA